MTGFVYGLRSLKDGKTYIGSTPNVTKRFDQHSKGYVKSTRNRRPFVLEFILEYQDIKTARKMELGFKKSHDSLIRELIRRGVVHR